MSFIRRHTRLALVALCCVALGAGASVIASAGAATGSAKATTAKAHARHGRLAELRALARRSVHANLVVATKTGFANVTIDRGKVDSVSGQQLTLTEGSKSKSYKTVTLTIPGTAKVRDDRKTSSLSSLTGGQRVIVIQAPKHTWVLARTPKG